MRKSLKLMCIGGAMLLSASLMTSCDNSVLTTGAAKDALKKEAVMRDSTLVHDLTLGYYEVDNDDIENLAQMQAAELVTFDVTRIVEKKLRYSYSYWGSYSYYEDVDHFFAQVDITPKGRKYVVSKVPTVTKEYEKDFPLEFTDESEEEPEWMNVDMDAIWAKLYPQQEIEAPSVEAAEAPAEEVADSVAVDSTAVEVVEAVEVEAPAESTPTKKVDPYQEALDRVYTENVKVLIGKIKIAKVKNIFCPKEFADNGKATCTFIMEFVDKTPFGWVFGAPREGQRFSWGAQLRRYEDAGWRIEDLDK